MVPEYFEKLPCHRTFAGCSISWFKNAGIQRFQEGIHALTVFYHQYGIEVIRIQQEDVTPVTDEDEFQIWSKKDSPEGES